MTDIDKKIKYASQLKYYEKIKGIESYKEQHKINCKKYYDKKKESEEYKQYKRDTSKQYYEKNKIRVIARVKEYQQKQLDTISRCYELENLISKIYLEEK